MKTEICFASQKWQEQLAKLWQEAFHDEKDVTDLFFETLFHPHDTLIYCEEGALAAALYLLPCKIVCSGEWVQAHYIYAAATFKKYRSKGYMRALLQKAEEYGVQRGDHFSILLPGEESLYRYYENNGYIPYFQKKVVTDSSAASQFSLEKIKPIDSKEFLQIRNDALGALQGAVLWDEAHLRFALGLGAKAYRLCDGGCIVLEQEENGEYTVLEFLSKDVSLLSSFQSAKSMVLPASSALYSTQGECMRAGMIKQLSDIPLPDTKTAYLGLPLQ